MKEFMTVYTCTDLTDSPCEPIETSVIGTFVERGKALDELTEHIVFRSELRPDLRWALWSGINHGDDLKEFLAKETGIKEDDLEKMFWKGNGSLIREDKKWVFYDKDPVGTDFNYPENVRAKLKEFVRDILGGDSCYYETTEDLGDVTFHFDIEENDVEGNIGLWACITSGRGDGDDPEFEQPFPEVFMSLEEAIECALKDIRAWCKSEGADVERTEDDINEVLCNARSSLIRFGNYGLDISCERRRHYDVWKVNLKLTDDKKE